MNDPGYLNIRSSLDTPITRTVGLDGGINVDLNADCEVIGVEKVSGDITLADLTKVLRATPFAEPAPSLMGYVIADTDGNLHEFHGEDIKVEYQGDDYVDLVRKDGVVHFRIRTCYVRYVERKKVPAPDAVAVPDAEPELASSAA